MARRLNLWAVAVACLVLGLFSEGGVNGQFGSQHPRNAWRHHGHGPHSGWGQPGFGPGPNPGGWGHPGFGQGPKPGGWGQPGFGPDKSAKLTQLGTNAPPSYTAYPGVGAYKFHSYGVVWSEAKRVCEQEGAKMLVVNSPAEAEVIKGLFKLPSNRHSPGAVNSNHVWVGVQEKGIHGQFITNDGQPLEQAGYLVWSMSPPQPNDKGTNDCVSFYSTGVLYDDPCHIKYPFVCEF